MSSFINTNVSSLTAQRNLSVNQSSLANSMQRLSSGLRINSAKDDAAGLAISQRMTAQINGLDQAARNANDAISLSQTAEGALGSIGDNLQRIRQLSVQAVNGTNSSSDRQAIQAEVTQLQQEINRVAGTTQFNGLNLLDGSLKDTAFQVGANANQTISMSISSAMGSALGNYKAASSAAVDGISAEMYGSANAVKSQNVAISGNGATSGAIAITAGETAKAIAAAINAAAGSTGVSATATTTATISNVQTGTATMTLTGAAAVEISATITDTADLSALAQAVNAQSSTTGITATADKSGNLVLTSITGDDIRANSYAGGAMGSAKIAGLTGSSMYIAFGDFTVEGHLSLNASSAFVVSGQGSNDTVFAANAASSSLNSLSSIDVSTAQGATDALGVIDSALNTINNQRANLGAIQNRFTSTITNLSTSTMNLTASRSSIQDADFAAETANLSRSQILQQAGVAMVAQANQMPQGVLALLR